MAEQGKERSRIGNGAHVRLRHFDEEADGRVDVARLAALDGARQGQVRPDLFVEHSRRTRSGSAINAAADAARPVNRRWLYRATQMKGLAGQRSAASRSASASWSRARVNPAFDGTNVEIADFLASSGSINPRAVPEPATWLMMLLGFGISGAMIRRRRMVSGRLGQLA